MSTQTKDAWTGTGYDADPPRGDSIYLRLKDKGETVRIRLVSEPYRFVDVIEDKGEKKPINKIGWIAIHKYMEGGKPQKKVVVFQGGPMIYGFVKDLAEHKEWGDPKLYDIEVTRTEQAGKYYTVAALPKPMGPISPEEEQMVQDANLDLIKLCTPKDGAGAGREQSGYSTEAKPDDYDPFADE